MFPYLKRGLKPHTRTRLDFGPTASAISGQEAHSKGRWKLLDDVTRMIMNDDSLYWVTLRY